MRRPCRSLPSRSCPCPTSGTALQTSRNATDRGAHLGDPMLRSQHIDVGLKTLPDKWHDLVDIQKCYRQSACLPNNTNSLFQSSKRPGKITWQTWQEGVPRMYGILKR